MSTLGPPSRRLSQLLWHHYRWHLWVGLAIGAGAALPYALLDYLRERRLVPSDSSAFDPAAISSLNGKYASLAFYCLLFGLIFAAVGGLVRHPLLVLVSRRAATRSELVWKSLLVFGASVALLAFIPWPIAYNQFSMSMVGRQFLASSLFSLPWLIATGLASRKLAAELGLPLIPTTE
ncbi:hypothetical protein [Hymenobacter sp.]|uniref:hypothetical protein n=1 Tax=Hymenobacter sp. TaxID=1898978 RepID=UPI00286B8218|nr:hypothetical protein [Hymenobacter sp.]